MFTCFSVMEHPIGFEPTILSFADSSLTTWLRVHNGAHDRIRTCDEDFRLKGFAVPYLRPLGYIRIIGCCGRS